MNECELTYVLGSSEKDAEERFFEIGSGARRDRERYKIKEIYEIHWRNNIEVYDFESGL